jgi:hypothetical protein
MQKVVEQIRQPPGEHVVAHPVHHCDQVEKAARHRDIADAGGLYLINPFDRWAARQIG